MANKTGYNYKTVDGDQAGEIYFYEERPNGMYVWVIWTENRDAPGGYSQKEYAIKKKEYEAVDSPILWKEVI